MTPEQSDTAPALSPLKRAFLALEDAQARLAAAEAASREPIAVIGIGCRVPGADGPDAFWELLRDGRDAVGPIPRDRFDIDAFFDADTEKPGGIAVREAGFVGAVDGFDPAFFGISMREARGMDPQQRLALEVAWEALEHAGQAPDRLSTTPTGVYVGQCSNDYAVLMQRSGDAALLDSHFTSGVAHSVTSGRISYLLGLQGPSLTIDTACSSSLVAVHLACQALRSRECRMALAGGVNLMLSEDLFIAFSHSRMLARDGRCKAFDAAADGFGRAEGCGMVVLKRLGDAQADGDRILAVIRGSAVNQDGPSSGLTAPNGPAQEAVIRAALAQAGLSPHQIGCIEAHGTGTQLGDPLEARALGQVFGPGRDAAAPLWLASVKTNLGHLEAAAGVSGLIKLVLSLQHRAIPPHLHLHQPSPHIPWSELPMRLPTTLQPWAPIDGRRLAGVSSFGFSGTNVHVVLEEAPPASTSSLRSPPPLPQLYTLSARDAEALRALARAHAGALADLPETAFAAACRTANTGRAQFAHRAVVTAGSLAELRTALEALAEDREAPGLRSGRLPRRDPPRIAFVFTGQGAQYAGMARGLYDGMPAFRAALDRCAAALEGPLGGPLLPLLFDDAAGGAGAGAIDRTEYTQPALFAVEVALAELWRQWGIQPSVAIGHSLGELAAACVAGVMPLEDAARLVCERARRMGALPAGGGMAAVAAPVDEVIAALAGRSQVGIAAVNAAAQTVIAGPTEHIDACCADFSARGWRCQRLKVSHAFHSPLVEPMLDGFEAVAQGVRWAAPRLPLVSNLSGEIATPAELASPRYWRRHVRETVRFADGVATLLAQRPDLCIEIGPHPALLSMVAPAAPGLLLLASLRRARADREQILESLATLYLEGAEIDWRAVHADQPGPPLALPTYPFQRERCWFSARPAAAVAAPRGRGTHPLLGSRVPLAIDSQVHQSVLCAESPRWIVQHRVQGHVVVPATAYLDMLLAAAAAWHGPQADTLEDVTVQQAMLLADDEGVGRRLQLIVDAAAAGAPLARLSSQPADAPAAAAWTGHVTARLPASAATASGDADTASLDAARAVCADPIAADAFYARLGRCGLDFGAAFRSVRRLWRGVGQALGEVALLDELAHERDSYRFHPVQLDGCLQVMAAALAEDGNDALFLPMAIGRYRLLRRPTGPCWAHAVAIGHPGGATRRADVRVFDADGTPVAELLDLQLKRIDARGIERLVDAPVDELIHEIAWRDASELPPLAPLALEAMVAAATAASAALHGETGLAAYDAAMPELERLCAALVARALHRLGCAATRGQRVATDTLAQRLAVAPRHRQLFVRLLAILGEQGWLQRDGADWIVRRDFDDAGHAAPVLHGDATALANELELTLRTGLDLDAALRGESDPLQLLFPGGDTGTAERVYRDAPPARFFNGMVARAAAAAAAARPASAPLRILEIGAGTGGTTAHVLPRLPQGTPYTFTDIGASFVARARERFGGDHPAMRFQVFDLEQEAAAQGLAGAQFDLVLASNVVHATADLRQSLRRIAGLLAPGGALLMLEACAPQAWFDLTVGLTEGWWRFTDHDLRPDYATLPREAWVRLLGECGFGTVEAIGGGPAEHGALARNTLLFAQRPVAAGRPTADWLLLADAGGLARQLAERLRLRGDRCELLRPGEFASLPAKLQQARESGRRWRGVIHACALDEPARWPAASMAGALQLTQALVATATADRLWLLTRGAQAAVGDDTVDSPAAATLWGFARALRLEHPELAAVVIDLDANPDLDAVVRELDDAGAEPERALRGTLRRVTRLVRGGKTPADVPGADGTRAAWQLAARERGSLDSLQRLPLVRRAPAAGEVEIAVQASGLNFKDVLNVLGMYPGDPGPLGAECAGRIASLGAGVEGFAVGDPVIALAGGSLASHVLARAELVVSRPDGIDAVDGASFAVAYLTAQFCLGHLAGLRSGQSVLVHAAAGGVGMAAVRLAQRAGAEVFATAGSPWKRALLHEMGVRHVFDSRSPSFAEALLAATSGRGVDVVLNALSGDLIEPSFAALTDGGCFVEIGKRGIKTPEWVEGLGRGIRYHVVDWGETARREPALVRRMFEGLVDALRDGSLALLPRHVFELDDAARAFRFMAQARHAGRIVLRHPSAGARVPIRGTHLVTGGLSGLGLALAGWLAERGARRLVLVGRRGMTPQAAPVVEAIRARGVEVIAEALDVSDAAGLRALLVRLRAGGAPLRGVWHSAGVLADAALLQQDEARFRRVFAAKVDGATLLDRLTRCDALDAFVLFASIAGLLGSAGQSNHSAANAFLDALAASRAAQALPALSIDWGAWRDTGAAADLGLAERLAAQGIGAMSTPQGLSALARLLERRTAQAAVLAIDWPTYLARTASAGVQPLLSEVGATPNRDAPRETAGSGDVRRQLEQAEPARRRSVLAAFVRERALRALGLGAQRSIDPRTPLGELGLDSLLAVELRNTLGSALGRTLPATLLFDHPTLDALTDHLLAELFPGSATYPTVAGEAPPSAAHRIVGSIEDMSDEEVERKWVERTRTKR